MRRTSVGGAVFALGLTLSILGCSSSDSSDPAPHQVSEGAGRADDVCAPGKAPDADEAPDAPCAVKNEYYVADLTDPDANADGAGNVGTQTLHTLDTPGTARASCNGKAGNGYTSCGSGGENCCRTAAVPAGSAGTIHIANGFELGVYEVTTARFTAFVDAFGGNLRGAANGGQLPGYSAANASKLPASRAAVDDELGPACKFRSDVSNYGARTWPSAEVAQTVASFITDNNARAADIRADATSSRLMAKPVNCVSYYMAAAFCAWDGGRLPTNAEWAYTALGGSQLRTYPWGAGRTADKLVTDLNHDTSSFTFPSDFPYFDNGFNAYHIAPPGRKPAGASRWGHQDMGGNVLEWTADVTGSNSGIVRGGSWEGHEDKNSFAFVNYPLDRTYGSLGFRCAYGAVGDPPPPPPPAAETAPVHRSYNGAIGDHLQGLTKGEGAPAYRYESVSFKVQKVAPANSSPLYRCRKGSFHFLSNSATCEGQTKESLLGYVLKTAAQGTAPIYRCRSANGNDHLSTQTPAECTKAGFVIEGTQGHALRP